MGVLKEVLKYLMAAAYIAAGVNHFANPDFYTKIMPPYIPAHETMVAWSGVAEVALGALLLDPRFRTLAAWGIVAMLVVFLTVHVHMLVNHEDFGMPYWGLVLRLPLQALLILWAWWYTRPEKGSQAATPLG